MPRQKYTAQQEIRASAPPSRERAFAARVDLPAVGSKAPLRTPVPWYFAGMRTAVYSFLVGAAALAACGGRVVVDGAPGEGGAGGRPGVAVSAQAVAVSAQAVSAQAVSAQATSASASSSAGSAGGGITCGGDPFPGIGAACDIPPKDCAVPFACCMAEAHCKQGTWQINSLSCQPNDCVVSCQPGGFFGFNCVAGAVCVERTTDKTTYQCRKNPCAGPLDCACAQPYCAEQGLKCVGIQDGTKVLCN
jgi:hypothetical protein